MKTVGQARIGGGLRLARQRRVIGWLALVLLSGCIGGYKDVSTEAPYKEYVGACTRLDFDTEVVQLSRRTDALGGASLYLEVRGDVVMPGLKQLQKYSSLGIPTTTLATFAPGTIIRVDRIAMHEDYESGNRLYLFGQIHGNASFTDINLNNVFRFGESRSDFLGPGGERVTCE